LFCAVVANDTFPWSKPDPRVLQATIKMAKADPARSIMVGDSRTDIDAARAAGIPVIAVNFGYSDVPVGDLEPDWIIPDFDALYPAARALLDGF
jgi:phosphoglycolate phosphatase